MRVVMIDRNTGEIVERLVNGDAFEIVSRLNVPGSGVIVEWPEGLMESGEEFQVAWVTRGGDAL